MTNKKYIGQTVSHRKNKNKYRPFGYEGRFKDHISEALCNTKKKQCTYLNNAIRHYGRDAFTIELIMTCPKEEMDKYEQYYINEYNSIYPNGYNLTSGGKTFIKITTTIESSNETNLPGKRGGCEFRSPETRSKMSKSLKAISNTPDARANQMLRSQKQHASNKINKFKDVVIDMDNIEQYIKVRKSKDGSQYIKIIVGTNKTSFTGKYESIEILRNRAIEFLQSVNQSATLPN
jgi:hypothetical protein